MILMKSPNHDARPHHGPDGKTVDMLVFHYTGMVSAGAALDRLCDPAAKVSAHYLIDEDGTIRVLVDESRRAWHAGVATWRGNSDINGRSIGIELVNRGHEFGLRPFADLQVKALISLAGDILARHAIAPRNVVGHSDIAPKRRQDPGELFSWRQMAAAGIGLWPEEPDNDGLPAFEDAPSLLAAYGYNVSEIPPAIEAFQRHFRPSLIDGVIDAETMGLLNAVVKMVA